MLSGAHVAVVVPAHNEAPFIAKVISAIPAFVDHVIVVDDASTDETREAATRTDDSRLIVLYNPHNLGVGASIARGYAHALDLQCDVVAVMAGDDQMHPDDLEKVVRPVVLNQADYVKGDRLHHPDLATMPLLRRLGTRVLGFATGLAVGLPKLSDSQCGFTAISARALDGLELNALWPRFGYPNDLLGLLVVKGCSVMDVVVRPRYGSERSELRARHFLVILALIVRAGWRVRVSRHLGT